LKIHRRYFVGVLVHLFSFLCCVWFFFFVLCLVCPVLPVSLGCWFLIAPSSCVSSVASVSELFILDCTFVLCLVCPVVPMSLGCSFLIAPSVFSNVYLIYVMLMHFLNVLFVITLLFKSRLSGSVVWLCTSIRTNLEYCPRFYK
jgi:hypothetical protein